MELEARCRFRIRDADWAARTHKGQYLGQAPDTPGGHLVLIPAESGGFKVLLTNTVFPMSAHDNKLPKPRYRLRSKSKPEFALRSISVATISLVLPNCRQACLMLT